MSLVPKKIRKQCFQQKLPWVITTQCVLEGLIKNTSVVL